MSDNLIRAKQLLSEVAQSKGPNVKLGDLSFQDLFIVNDLCTSGYLDGGITVNDQAVVRLTLAGRNYLRELSASQKPWWEKAKDNIIENAWSIGLAVLISWAIYYFGAPIG